MKRPRRNRLPAATRSRHRNRRWRPDLERLEPRLLLSGLVTSQGDRGLLADQIRAQVPGGYDGTGIRIGVISNSFDLAGTQASIDIANGDLPAGGVELPLGDATGATKWWTSQDDEGRGMLQIIHDLAPGATLVFIPAGGTQESLAAAIRSLADPVVGNADIIVDDIFVPAEPMFQDGIVSQAISDMVAQHGIAYVTAAGNFGTQAYESTSFTTTADTLGGVSELFYDFDPSAGADTRQRVFLCSGKSVAIELQWDDPFYTTNGVTTDLDFYLVRAGTNDIVAASTWNNVQDVDLQGYRVPREHLGFTNTGPDAEFDLMIRHRSATESAGRLKWVNFTDGGDHQFRVLEFANDAPSVTAHAGAPGARAVAALA